MKRKLLAFFLLLNFHFVQAQSVTLNSVPAFICAGDSIVFNYTVSGNFNTGNIFSLQVSDKLGSFTTPTTLASKQAKISGAIKAWITTSLVTGDGYRFRMTSSSPVTTGADNGSNVHIDNVRPNILASGPLTFNDGGSVTLNTTTPAISYQWMKWGYPLPGATQNFISETQSGGYAVAVDYSNGCSNISDTMDVVMVPTTTNQHPPNILLFIIDDAAYNVTDVTGAPFFFDSPNMDRIAYEGCTFTNTFVVYSECVPSRATMLSGLYPHINGATTNGARMNRIYPTVATILHDDGYYTAQVGKYHIEATPQPGYDYWCGAGTLKYNNPTFDVNGVQKTINGYFTDIVTDTTVALINRMPQPFFLLMEHYAPHKPWTPAAQDDSLWNDLKMPAPYNYAPYQNNFPSFIYKIPPALQSPFLGSGMDSTMRHYFQTLVDVDRSMSAVLQALQNKNILDSTVVVFISDNGFLDAAHSLGGKILSYEESMKVPIFIRYPKWFSDSTVIKNQIALNLDIAPTCLDAAGIITNYNMQGVSLKKLAQGTAQRNQMLYECLGDTDNNTSYPSQRTLRDFHYKYNHYFCNSTTEEFFDLQKDPYELTNLINDPNYSTLISQYRTRLDSMRLAFADVTPLDSPLWVCKLDSSKTGPTFTVLLKPTDETCNNKKGKVTLTTTGGTIPFTYSWSNGKTSKNLSNVHAGTFTVTVKDGKGLKVVASTVVKSVKSLYNTVVPEDTTICKGNTVTLNGNINKMKTVVVTPNKAIPDNKSSGLSSSANVSGLTLPARVHSVQVNIVHRNIADLEIDLTCPDGTKIVLVNKAGEGGENFLNTVFIDTASTLISDGTAPFTGAFHPQTSLSTVNTCTMNGTWKLKVIDQGLNDFGTLVSWSITFEQNANSTTHNWSPTTYLTNSATLTPTSTPAAAITYNLISSDPTCVDSAESQVNLFQSTAPTLSANGPTTFCTGNSVILSAPSGYSSYQWYKGSSAIAMATVSQYTATSQGKYSTSVVDTNGCHLSSDTIKVSVPCKSAGEFAEDENLKVYPNPTSSIVTIEVKGNYEAATIVLLSADGNVLKEMKSDFAEGNKVAVDLQNFSAGNYLLKITLDDEVRMVKVVKLND